MNVFVDTNVLMDVLLSREPFVADSQRIWYLAERGKIKALVSSLSFPNIFYVVRRLRDRQAALEMLTMLRDTFIPIALDEQILNQAMDAGFVDFEDAIQYFTALRAEAECIVTRNPSHFPRKNPAALTPAEFLVTHSLT